MPRTANSKTSKGKGAGAEGLRSVTKPYMISERVRRHQTACLQSSSKALPSECACRFDGDWLSDVSWYHALLISPARGTAYSSPPSRSASHFPASVESSTSDSSDSYDVRSAAFSLRPNIGAPLRHSICCSGSIDACRRRATTLAEDWLEVSKIDVRAALTTSTFRSYQPKKRGGYLAAAHGCQRTIDQGRWCWLERLRTTEAAGSR
jgi:hypothetical protein